MVQNVVQRLNHRIETRISGERQPVIFDAPPKDFDQVSLRRIRGQICDEQSVFLPVRHTVFQLCTPMDGGMVHDHHGLLGDRATKRIKTGNHHACVDRLFKHIGMQIILAIHKPQDIDATIAPGRQFDDALGLLPGVGNRGIKRKAGFIKIIEVNLSFVFLFL